jgi:hypothetical protein
MTDKVDRSLWEEVWGVPFATSVRAGVDGVIRHLSNQIGLGVTDAMRQTELTTEGNRARAMARGFMRGVDDGMDAARVPQRAAELVRTAAGEVRSTVIVIGGCLAGALGVAAAVFLLTRAVSRNRA